MQLAAAEILHDLRNAAPGESYELIFTLFSPQIIGAQNTATTSAVRNEEQQFIKQTFFCIILFFIVLLLFSFFLLCSVQLRHDSALVLL